MVEKPGKRIIIRGLSEEEYQIIYPLKRKYKSWDEAMRRFIIPIYKAIIMYRMKIITGEELLNRIEEVME